MFLVDAGDSFTDVLSYNKDRSKNSLKNELEEKKNNEDVIKKYLCI